jgi:predicted Fe-Mo cluster-binding NifX family protein
MKIAFVTDEGLEISRHFGRAGSYLVVEIENGTILGRELREKMSHQHFSGQESGHEHHGNQHGFDRASQSKHASMLSAIEDCEVVICGGMGQGAHQSIVNSGKQVFMVEELDINMNLQKFISGELSSVDNLVH